MHNRYGLHWANVHINEQLGRWALDMGGDCYLVIDGGYGWIPKIREARPNAIIIHRHAVPNWMEMEPTDWARQMTDLFHQHERYTKHVELECEPDIFPFFPGWGQPIVDRLKFAAEWNIAVAEKLRILCPGVVVHSPPLAHERLDLPHWFKIWKPVMDACDVLDMHCYWERGGHYFGPGLYDEQESYHRAFRYRKIRDFLQSRNYWKPMMVTECGNFAPDRPDYAQELAYYFSQLERDAAYMIGGCVFILKSNVHNRVNDLTRQPDVKGFFHELGTAQKKVLRYPETVEPEPQPDPSWARVPEQVRRWYGLLASESMRHWPYQTIPFKGVQLHGDRIGAAIILCESGGDPNTKSKEPALIYNGQPIHAWGLGQIIPKVEGHPSFHHRPTIEELLVPAINVKWLMAIFHGSLTGTQGDLWEALRRYSGFASAEYTLADFWWRYGMKFRDEYKDWFGIDIPEPELDQLAICRREVVKLRQGVETIENIAESILKED